MSNKVMSRLNILGLTLAILFVSSTPLALAQTISWNYDKLSLLDSPMAIEVGDVTLSIKGLLDTTNSYSIKNHYDSTHVIGNVQLSLQTQLPNRWRVEAVYYGQIDNVTEAETKKDYDYTDNAALSIGGVWGAVLGGNASSAVREDTRRSRGVGNGLLIFDDFFGVIENENLGYKGRFGPWVLTSVMDGNGDFDIGVMSQRPMGNKDCRFTARTLHGTYSSGGNQEDQAMFDTTALGMVGELIYGSTLFDLGIGYEQFRSSNSALNRWFVSKGMHVKVGVVSASLEGHFGRIEGDDEVSVAFGVQYDIARGVSTDLGINYWKITSSPEDIEFLAANDSEVVFSIRYDF